MDDRNHDLVLITNNEVINMAMVSRAAWYRDEEGRMIAELFFESQEDPVVYDGMQAEDLASAFIHRSVYIIDLLEPREDEA